MAENTHTLKTKPTIQAELYIYIITKYGSNRDDTGCPALCPYIWDFRVSYNITKEKGGKLFQVKRTLGERQTFSLSLSWRTIPIWLLYWFGIAIEPSATLPKLTSCSIAYCKHTAGFLSVQKSHTCGRSNIKSYWDTETLCLVQASVENWFGTRCGYDDSSGDRGTCQRQSYSEGAGKLLGNSALSQLAGIKELNLEHVHHGSLGGGCSYGNNSLHQIVLSLDICTN